MSFDKTFCPSPWLHMQINNQGNYIFCRWKQKTNNVSVCLDQTHNISSSSPLEYFQNSMAAVRDHILSGNIIPDCNDCYKMEKHGKVSGRQRQLLKTGIMLQYFDKSLLSSPYYLDFKYSSQHNGLTDRVPVDWQIDLGNYCNSACVFCTPEYSSRLATEFKKVGLNVTIPAPNWCDDPTLLNRFLADLLKSNSKYLHFIGGETIIIPAFKKILQTLVDSGQSKQITIGFTTNLTVWDDDLIELFKNFEQINVGLSIETLTSLNDYVRYPGKLDLTKNYLRQWINLSNSHNWLTQLRITPSCLTIHELTTVYDYAWENRIAIESCNFLHKPEFMRIGVLPLEQRQQATDRLQMWVDTHTVGCNNKIINTRSPDMFRQQLVQDAQSYINYLQTAEDESFRLPELITYLKKLETNRCNSILEYIPEYEQLFRLHGY